MATIITHGLASVLIGKTFLKKKHSGRFWFYIVICSMLPDLDVIGFNFGISYGDFWGHRGFSHSILFACLFGLGIGFLFYKHLGLNSKNWWGFVALYSGVIASHGVFDALTDGGLGVAFFSPFENSRYFFPWTPIHVSPIGIRGFFSQRGLNILISETIYILTPLIIVFALAKFTGRKKGVISN